MNEVLQDLYVYVVCWVPFCVVLLILMFSLSSSWLFTTVSLAASKPVSDTYTWAQLASKLMLV